MKIPLLKSLFSPQTEEERRAEVYRSLIHWSAGIGGELFGPVPKGTRREFFCLDARTWVWHEEWNDSDGHHTMTTRYDVRPSGIVKSQGNNVYELVGHDEAKNFLNAVNLYYERVMPELVRMRDMAR